MRNLLDRVARIAGVCVATLATLTVQAADLPQQEHIEAVWKAQRLAFVYRSAGRLYPCATLEYKIKMVLRRLGARDRIELRGPCRDLARFARFEVLVESPIAATVDNIRNITRYDGEDELVARMHGTRLPSPEDVQRFPAAWESISFRRASGLDLDAGDCALVQQLRRQILPHMSVQVTTEIGVDCAQELAGIAKPRLAVLALVPASTLQ